MCRITGNFILQITTNGNLLGEYTNTESLRVCVEAAQRNPDGGGDKSKFLGSYRSIWIEESETVLSANLVIMQKPGSDELFELRWSRSEGNHDFSGEGFISGDNLIGSYQSD